MKYAELQKKIQSFWALERHRLILWIPVLFGIGVGCYFALPSEPPQHTLTLASVMLGVSLLLSRRHPRMRGGLLLVFLVMTGVTGASWRTHQVEAPFLHKDLRPQEVMGVVERIDTQPDNSRLLLSHVQIEHVKPEVTPKLVTISLREHAPKTIEIGDTIRAYAGFFPPPPPALPGGFQFNRHFYFQSIGGNGFVLGKNPPEIIAKHTEERAFSQWLTTARHALSEHIMQAMGPPENTIATALITAEKRAIPDSIRQDMQRAGLAHVLAISGMHLGLVTAIFFFTARLLLVCIPGFALRFHAKKWAAFIALVGAFAYLCMAGFPISAQRAFVMVALVLLAVVLDRNVMPVRSLALAAMIILIVTPEALLTPSFQLSFAATLGILAYYEYWISGLEREGLRYMTTKERFARFWLGIITTSTIATAATAPFVLHHFEEFPTYSVLGNLLVLPIISFWIMPVIVGVMLLLPFGLAGLLFPLLEWGIDAVLYLASWVSALPFAVSFPPPLSTSALLVMTAGGLWLCLWQTSIRHAGWLPIVAGLASLLFYHPPDMVVSNDGKKLALRTDVGRVVMLQGQRKGFTQEQWLRAMGVREFSLYRSAKDPSLTCDDRGCLYVRSGKHVALPSHRQALAEDCQQADLTLAAAWSVYENDQRPCQNQWVLDRGWISYHKGAAFWIEEDGIRIQTVREVMGDRPWVGR